GLGEVELLGECQGTLELGRRRLELPREDEEAAELRRERRDVLRRANLLDRGEGGRHSVGRLAYAAVVEVDVGELRVDERLRDLVPHVAVGRARALEER